MIIALNIGNARLKFDNTTIIQQTTSENKKLLKNII